MEPCQSHKRGTSGSISLDASDEVGRGSAYYVATAICQQQAN